MTENKKLSRSAAMMKLFTQVKRDADPVMQFVEERLVLTDVEAVEYDNASETVSVGPALLQAYRDFCSENGYFPLGRNKFFTAIQRHGVLPVDTSRSRQGRPARRVKGWLCKMLDVDEVFKAG